MKVGINRSIHIFTVLLLAVLLIGTLASAGTPIIIGSKPVKKVADSMVADGLVTDGVFSDDLNDPDGDAQIDVDAGPEVRINGNLRPQDDDLQVSGNTFERVNDGLIIIGGINPINDDLQVNEPEINGDFGFSGELGEIEQGLDEQSDELHIHSSEVIGEAVAGQAFTVAVTATDGDDLVTRIGLGTEPYALADYEIRDCNPADHTCTEEFSIMETTAGVYIYELKAKNDQDQISIDEITVTVVENPETAQFNFRTAAMDGSEYDSGNIDYVDSQITIWGDAIAEEEFNGQPFINIELPSDARIGAIYSAEGYTQDEDYLMFDSRLPSCTGAGCDFVREIEGDSYTTTCELEGQDDHYACTLTTGDDYYITFDFRAEGDPLGPNTIRRYNPIYQQASPIVEFQDLEIEFAEGGSASIDLDDYVHDADTDPAQLEWTVTNNQYVEATIDQATHEVTFTQKDTDWLGGDIMRFIATDPQGNSDSDWMTAKVTQSDNDAPVITYRFPDQETVNVGEGSTLMFSIDAMDPDYDLLTVEWYKEGELVAQDVFNYLYTDEDGLSHPVEVMVSDGQETASESWTTNIVEPIGTVEGTVTDAGTELALQDAQVELLGGESPVDQTTTDQTGFYTMTVHDGSYTLRFTKDGYQPLELQVTILAGETIVQNAQLQEIPPQVGDVQGTVIDRETSAQLEGVTVEALSQGSPVDSTVTNAAGFYGMTDLDVGTYTLRFTRTGYEPLEIPDVEILLDQVTVQDAQMLSAPMPGTIEGTVRDEQGTAISGALVRVLDGQDEIDSQPTGETGHYSIDVAAGTYDVEVSKDGYKTITDTGVVVDPDSVTTRDYQMVKWWNDDWQHYKTISITAPTTPRIKDKIDVWIGDDAHISSTAKPDYSDIRVVKDHHTPVEFELHTGSNGIEWIRFFYDAAESPNTDYSIYYGNPLASPAAVDNIGYIFEDFNNGDLADGSHTSEGVKAVQYPWIILNDTVYTHEGYAVLYSDQPKSPELLLDFRFTPPINTEWEGHLNPIDGSCGSDPAQYIRSYFYKDYELNGPDQNLAVGQYILDGWWHVSVFDYLFWDDGTQGDVYDGDLCGAWRDFTYSVNAQGNEHHGSMADPANSFTEQIDSDYNDLTFSVKGVVGGGVHDGARVAVDNILITEGNIYETDASYALV